MYQYLLSVDMTVAAALQNYEPLLFPSLRKRVMAEGVREPLLMVAAVQQQQLVGVALANVDPHRRLAEVLSLFVVPEHRERGVGAGLLRHLEGAVRKQGYTLLRLAFRSEWKRSAALVRMLQQQGWSEPQPRMLLCKSTIHTIAAAPWMSSVQLPEGFEIFPWAELSSVERQAIVARQTSHEWFPDVLTPFQEERRIEPLNSLGLRYQAEVVGWMITHRLDSDTIQYTTMFIRPPFQGLGRAIPLLAESIRRQIASGVLNGIYQVDVENAPMVRFVQRRMKPYLTSLHSLYIAHKTLG